MAYWKFTGTSATYFPEVGITANPGEVFSFGADGPPRAEISSSPDRPSPIAAASTLWTSDDGPAKTVAKAPVTVSAASTLTLDAPGQVFVFTGTTATWTLPAVSGNTGVIFRCKNRGSDDLTIESAGSDEIYDADSDTSLVVAAGDSTELVNDGTYWVVLSGTRAVAP